jgi:hypothetical protein
MFHDVVVLKNEISAPLRVLAHRWCARLETRSFAAPI